MGPDPDSLPAMLALVSLFVGLACASSYENELHLEHSADQSLYVPFINADGRNDKWDFNALVSIHDFVQLTPDLPNTAGHAFARKQLQAKNGWVVEFTFDIKTQHQVNAADGMAFWFTQDWYSNGNAFGNSAKFRGLGVFFDLYRNNGSVDRHYPWISAMVNDGSVEFSHETDGVGQTTGGCHRQIVNTKHLVHARVSYYGRTLTVELQIDDADWEQCIVEHNVTLPDHGYIGFSAHTGSLTARHNLYNVLAAVYNQPAVMPAFQSFNKNMLPSIPKSLLGNGLAVEHSHAFWWMSVVVIVILIAGIVVAYGAYNSKAKRQHFA